jgi:hypothetical protein
VEGSAPSLICVWYRWVLFSPSSRPEGLTSRLRARILRSPLAGAAFGCSSLVRRKSKGWKQNSFFTGILRLVGVGPFHVGGKKWTKDDPRQFPAVLFSSRFFE